MSQNETTGRVQQLMSGLYHDGDGDDGDDGDDDDPNITCSG